GSNQFSFHLQTGKIALAELWEAASDNHLLSGDISDSGFEMVGPFGLPLIDGRDVKSRDSPHIGSNGLTGNLLVVRGKRMHPLRIPTPGHAWPDKWTPCDQQFDRNIFPCSPGIVGYPNFSPH